MKQFSTFVISLVFCTTIFATAEPLDRMVQDSGIAGVLLPRGTEIPLRFLNSLRSEDLQEGSLVNMQVLQNVVVGNEQVVILEHSLATARVKRIKRRGVFGKGALIELEPVSVSTIDGRTMPLECAEPWVFKGRQRQEIAWGLSMSIPAIGLILLNPYLLPVAAVGLLIKGSNVKVSPTTQLRAFTSKSMRIYK